MPIHRLSLLIATVFPLIAFGQGDELAAVIREESLRLPHDPAGRPLPLAAHWHTGRTVRGYGPAYQKGQLDAGHYLLPWFAMPVPGENHIDTAYYEEPIRRAARLKLPLVFLGTQWERLLTSSPEFFNLPADRNANVVKSDGTIDRKVSPFGPVAPWRQVGRIWGSHPQLAQIQEWYPDPPLVIFLSNNEHAKLRWTEVEQCRTYLDKFDKGKSDIEKRQIVSAGWKERYEALFAGMRDGLIENEWKKNARFVGYNAFLPSFAGRWPGWPVHSLTYPKKVSAWADIWDGASMPYYTNPWDGSTDCDVWSPQVEAMNWVAGLKLLPPEKNFWFELSTWDGNVPGKPNDKRLQYAQSGQTYSPERYGGYVQFGMWLTRPRVVREFRAHNETLGPTEPYFLQVMAAVDRVHRTPELVEFWRKGELVANRARKHPYNTGLPQVFEGVDRWFRLDTNLDPKEPWKLHTQLPVFALALVLGEKPNRRWLLYAHAPLGERSAAIRIPDFGETKVDVPLTGGFWLVDETAGSATPQKIAAE